MERDIYDFNSGRFLGTEEAGEPVCGKDFCDRCGDCLHCYYGESCGGACHWVRYEGADQRSVPSPDKP